MLVVREHPKLLKRDDVIVRVREELCYSFDSLSTIARNVLQPPTVLSTIEFGTNSPTYQQLRVKTRSRSSDSDMVAVGGQVRGGDV